MKVYTPDDLVYAACKRCICGEGMSYVKNDDERRDIGNAWVCSYLLTNDVGFKIKKQGNGLFGQGIIEDDHGVEHIQSLPFVSWEIKSENTPSAYGRTTRPQNR